jgi:hypothetical protein
MMAAWQHKAQAVVKQWVHSERRAVTRQFANGNKMQAKTQTDLSSTQQDRK